MKVESARGKNGSARCCTVNSYCNSESNWSYNRAVARFYIACNSHCMDLEQNEMNINFEVTQKSRFKIFLGMIETDDEKQFLRMYKALTYTKGNHRENDIHSRCVVGRVFAKKGRKINEI